MIKNKFSYLGVAEAKYSGAVHDYVNIVNPGNKQINVNLPGQNNTK